MAGRLTALLSAAVLGEGTPKPGQMPMARRPPNPRRLNPNGWRPLSDSKSQPLEERDKALFWLNDHCGKMVDVTLQLGDGDSIVNLLEVEGELSHWRQHEAGQEIPALDPAELHDDIIDCSSAVSHLLQVGGFHNPTMDTVGLASWGDPGPGREVTIHVKPYGPEAHTFIEFMPGVTPPAERYWGRSNSHPGGGPGWIPQSAFSASYLAGFALRHPPGL